MSEEVTFNHAWELYFIPAIIEQVRAGILPPDEPIFAAQVIFESDGPRVLFISSRCAIKAKDFTTESTEHAEISCH